MSPVFVDKEGKEAGGLTNQVLVRLKSTEDYPLLARSIASYNIQTIEPSGFDAHTYTITHAKDSINNVLKVANELY